MEDKVKRHGVKGVKDSKDDGVKGSFVSFRQACHYYSTNHLLLICQSLSLQLGYWKRRKGNGGRGQAPWCEGFEGRCGQGNLREFLTSMLLLLNQTSLTDLLNHLSLQLGYWKC
jgi:hypothetical protein